VPAILCRDLVSVCQDRNFSVEIPVVPIVMVAMADLDIQSAKRGKQIVNTERKSPLTTDELPQPAANESCCGISPLARAGYPE
jgi:hypothetical protein